MIKGVKAREYSLVPWILTLIIVLFLMFIYLALLGFLTGEKILFGEGNQIKVVGAENGILFENLKGVLDSEVEFRGERVDIVDAVILHLENYDSKNVEYVNESRVLSGLIVGLMKERCDRFYILTDFGLISEKGLSLYQDVTLEGALDFNIYFNGEVFKIKYKEVSCDGK